MHFFFRCRPLLNRISLQASDNDCGNARRPPIWSAISILCTVSTHALDFTCFKPALSCESKDSAGPINRFDFRMLARLNFKSERRMPITHDLQEFVTFLISKTFQESTKDCFTQQIICCKPLQQVNKAGEVILIFHAQKRRLMRIIELVLVKDIVCAKCSKFAEPVAVDALSITDWDTSICSSCFLCTARKFRLHS